jgi:hypothetical protein
MNKYTQDIFGIIRGMQLIANASVKTQEAYLKQIWSNSSVREAIDNNIRQTTECGKKVLSNPSQELQNVNHYLKESVERSSVVFEGFRQYMSNGRNSEPIGALEYSNDKTSKSYSTIKNIKDLDIASITLKELENMLAEHNKIREVNLRIDENFKPKKPRKVKHEQKLDLVENIPVTPSVSEPQIEIVKQKVSPKIVEDEKRVETMMSFITNFDKTPVKEEVKPKVTVQEVSI